MCVPTRHTRSVKGERDDGNTQQGEIRLPRTGDSIGAGRAFQKDDRDLALGLRLIVDAPDVGLHDSGPQGEPGRFRSLERSEARGNGLEEQKAACDTVLAAVADPVTDRALGNIDPQEDPG